MVAAWLTELHLSSLNAALLEEGGASGTAYETRRSELVAFLSAHVGTLDVNTTTGLLAAYGRLDELAAFAAARGDHEAVLDHLLQRLSGPDGATKCGCGLCGCEDAGGV